MRALSDLELQALTGTFKTRLAAGEALDALLPEVLAAGREAGVRALGQRAVDEQIAGAAALCRGRLVEMKTGEGKTLAIAIAAYAWSLPGESVRLYRNMTRAVEHLDRGRHVDVDEARQMATLTEVGIARMEDLLGVADLYQEAEPELQRALDDTLRARFAYARDRDYVVLDGVVSALNLLTGRIDDVIAPPDGLRQALEIKEGLKVTARRRILGMISHRALLRRYPRLAAATGTALEDRLCLEGYGLTTERIPTHSPVLRIDHPPTIYPTGGPRVRAALDRIAERRAAGRPVLVVTASIAQCGEFSAALSERGIPHEVLTAANHRQEAEIISRAGRVGAVTVVTRMAGRGLERTIKFDKGALDTSIMLAGAMERGLDKATRRLEDSMLTRFRIDDIREDQAAEIYRLRDGFLDGSRAHAAFRACLDSYLASGDGELEELVQTDLESAYRRRAERLSEPSMLVLESRAGMAMIDTQWPDHLVALQDVSAETTLHGLSGSAGETRYRLEAKRLFRALRARIDREVVRHVLTLEPNPDWTPEREAS
jgi:preprotein translocase subunit SecA